MKSVLKEHKKDKKIAIDEYGTIEEYASYSDDSYKRKPYNKEVEDKKPQKKN